MLVPLDGPAFAGAYLAAMVKNHNEVLAMIDGQLLPNTANPALKQHLTQTRSSIEQHLQDAKRLQGNLR